MLEVIASKFSDHAQPNHMKCFLTPEGRKEKILEVIHSINQSETNVRLAHISIQSGGHHLALVQSQITPIPHKI